VGRQPGLAGGDTELPLATFECPGETDGCLGEFDAQTAADARAQSMWSLCLTVTGLIIGFGAPLMGALAAAAVAVIFGHMLAADRRLGADAIVFQASAGFDPDDAIPIAPIGMVLGAGDWVLAAAVVAAPIAAGVVVWHLRRMLAQQARPGTGDPGR